MMNWLSVACELHCDWRNDIEGLGNLLSLRNPNYRNLINGYDALTAKSSAPERKKPALMQAFCCKVVLKARFSMSGLAADEQASGKVTKHISHQS